MALQNQFMPHWCSDLLMEWLRIGSRMFLHLLKKKKKYVQKEVKREGGEIRWWAEFQGPIPSPSTDPDRLTLGHSPEFPLLPSSFCSKTRDIILTQRISGLSASASHGNWLEMWILMSPLDLQNWTFGGRAHNQCFKQSRWFEKHYLNQIISPKFPCDRTHLGSSLNTYVPRSFLGDLICGYVMKPQNCWLLMSIYRDSQHQEALAPPGRLPSHIPWHIACCPGGHGDFRQHVPSTLSVQAGLGQMTSLDWPSLNSQVHALWHVYRCYDENVMTLCRHDLQPLRITHRNQALLLPSLRVCKRLKRPRQQLFSLASVACHGWSTIWSQKEEVGETTAHLYPYLIFK